MADLGPTKKDFAVFHFIQSPEDNNSKVGCKNVKNVQYSVSVFMDQLESK